jgi:hypothetical protein
MNTWLQATGSKARIVDYNWLPTGPVSCLPVELHDDCMMTT